MWGALLGAMIPSALQYFGQQQTNETNINMAREATRANMEEADRARKWQEQMSNTAHQREVSDLTKAGLNPVLSANSGASTPSGSSGNAVAAKVDNPLGGLGAMVTSAMDVLKTFGEIDMQAAQKDLIKTQAAGIRAEIPRKFQETEKSKHDIKMDRFQEETIDLWDRMFKRNETTVASAKSIGQKVGRDFFGKNGWEKRPPSTQYPKKPQMLFP